MSEALVPTDRPTRVGIVGLGRIYDLNITAYRDFPEVEVVALCDRDEAKLATRHKAATGKWRRRRDRLGARTRPGRLDCPLDKAGRHDTRHPDRDTEPGAVGP